MGGLRVMGTGGHHSILLVRPFFVRGCPNSSPHFCMGRGGTKGWEADRSLSYKSSSL